MIRTFFVAFAILYATSTSAQSFFEKSNLFFSTYVSNNTVDYKSLANDATNLKELIQEIENQDLTQLTEPDKKAFLINSYNLLVINQVVENWPTASVMDIGGFFDANKVLVAGKKMTLNDLENNEIRKTYNDPRVHFVLVCGAKGCPPIIKSAYLPETLNEQLDQQTKLALNNPSFIKIEQDGTVKISEIFNWYKQDFTESGTVIDYINRYRNKPISNEVKPKYYPYDWSLNVTSTPSNSSSSEIMPFDPEEPSTNADLNLQTYNAGSLLKKGQLDVTLFNSIYTENENNWQGEVYSGYRTTFASSLIQMTYGVSKSARINMALDISLKGSGTSRNNNEYSQISRAFDFRNDDTTRFGVSYIAPKIKIQPFKNVDEFTLQSSFNIVLPQHPEGYTNPDGTGDGNLYWIEWDRYVWWTQLFYSKTILNDKFQVFGEFDFLFRFANSSTKITHVDLPASLFFSYFPTKKITAYTMIQHVPRFVYDTGDPTKTDWIVSANYSQYGLGFKYQFSSRFNLELLYSNFFSAQNNGLGETYNLGLKYIFN